MSDGAGTARFEPRWPVGLTLVAVLMLLVLLPERLRVVPLWMVYALGFVAVGPMLAVGLSAGRERWLRIERASLWAFVTLSGMGLLWNLANLVGAILFRSAHTSGLQLLTSSVALWVTNVLVFALLYWHLDRDGPEGRLAVTERRPDWMFAQDDAPGSPDGWRPDFVDYLYLAYSTATSFSATDTVPITSRAKLLMMLESTISLLTLTLVASRAINILGS